MKQKKERMINAFFFFINKFSKLNKTKGLNAKTKKALIKNKTNLVCCLFLYVCGKFNFAFM